MKRIIIILAITGMAFFANAQGKSKFGYVDAAGVLTAMPEYASAKTELDAYYKTLEEQLQSLELEYRTKLEEFQNNPDWPDAIKEAKATQIQSQEQTLQSTRVKLSEDYAKKEQQKLNELRDKVKTAVENVAKKNGYTYIFDSSTGIFLYMPESDDVSSLVKKELGITG